MIVVLASQYDATAAAVVESWGERARLMTVADLATAGWRIRLDRPLEGDAVIGGEAVPVAEIEGVLTCLTVVPEWELGMIGDDDRAYAAAEAAAFLRYWLTALPCRVLNRPAASSLSGPVWRREQWNLVATRLGIDALPCHRSTPAFGQTVADPAPDADGAGVTVVGDRCLGTVDERLAHDARRLAQAAGVELLRVQYDGAGADARVVDASRFANLGDPDVAGALLDLLNAP